MDQSHRGKRLLILGGNRYNIPSIRSAKDAGFFVFVADRNPHAAGFAEADIALAIDLFAYDELITAVQAHGGVDGVVSMAEAGVRPMAELSQRLELSNITPQAAINATSKASMRQQWANSPYSVPYRVVTALPEAEHAVAEIGYPCLMKPALSFGGSRGVNRIDDASQIAQSFTFAIEGGLADSPVVIEGFAQGSEHSAEVLIYNGDVSVLCIGEKVKTDYPYRVDISVQYPANIPDRAHRNIKHMAQIATESLGLTQGIAHMEFALDGDHPTLFELGARCGGGHTPQIAHHVSGVDEFIEYCRMACGLAPSQFTPIQQRGADYRFLIYPPGIIESIQIPDAVHQHPGIFDVGITVQAGDTIHPLKTTAHRIGFAVCFADTRKDAVALGEWVQDQVRIDYVKDHL